MTSLPIHHFTPIALPDLLAEAELLTRVDRKYLLDRCQATEFLSRLDSGTRVLTIDGRRSFRYQSVYFDTPDLLSYRQAAHARRHRFKVRTRSYLDSDLAFLEVKVRGDREVTVKERIGYDPAAVGHLTGSGRDYAADILQANGLDNSVASRLAPALATSYSRTTLVPPEPGVRVTIDTELSWSDASSLASAARSRVRFLPNSASGRQICRLGPVYDENCTAVDRGTDPDSLPACRHRVTAEPGLGLTVGFDQHRLPLRVADPGEVSSLTRPELVIIETKSGGHPSVIDRLLWRSGHRPATISKYGTGLAALRGDLPANKWARVLRRHFPTTEDSRCAA